jgi:hypothetical protein
MPRHQDALPRRQRPVDVVANRLDAAVKALDRPLPLGRTRQHRERLDLFQQEGNRFFEFERIGGHDALS